MAQKPPWFDEAARLLVTGHSITATADAVGVSRVALSNRLRKPGSSLKAEVDRRRGVLSGLSSDTAAKAKTTLERVMAVLERNLDSDSDKQAMEAAKILLAKLLPNQPQVVHVEEKPAEPATPEEIVRETAATLVDVAFILAEGDVSNEAIALLSEAAAQVVAALPPAAPPAVAPTTQVLQ